MVTVNLPQRLLLLGICLVWPHAAHCAPAIRLTNLGLSPPLHSLLAPSASARIAAPFRATVGAQVRSDMIEIMQGPVAQSGIAPTTSRRVSPVDTGGTRLNLDAGAASPDMSGAVGVDQYVQVSAGQIAIHDKADGRVLLSARAVGALFSSLCDGRAAVHYDALAHRWIITQAAGTRQCIAVSTTPDAASTYARYAIDTAGAQVADTALSVWTDAYYVTAILFDAASGAYLGPRICGLERNALLRGTEAAMRCRDPGSAFGPVSAAHADAYAPLAPNYLVSVDFTKRGTGERLVLWRFSFARDSLSRPTALPVAPFSALGDRLGGHLSYRNDDGRESLVATHTVRQPDGTAALRWYELRAGEHGMVVYQQGTHAPDGDSRWNGAIGMDREGNIALAYNAAGMSGGPGVRYTGRLRSGAPGRLDGEETIVNGAGLDLGTAREAEGGSALALDPVDGCTFWSTQRYVPLTGRDTARARIATFRFENCR